jgi:GH18 family chitinase
MMTYDLHGVWDKGNKWLGEYLNSHTNLIEIDSALDLLWRNDIPPDRVVLGLGFYARTFTVASTTCKTPGCKFVSGGRSGLCSRDVGTLTNAEIADIIEEKGLTPTLYQKEAVKIITWDDQYIAYNDVDTYELKMEYARSLGLGGVMV